MHMNDRLKQMITGQHDASYENFQTGLYRRFGERLLANTLVRIAGGLRMSRIGL